MALMLPSEAVAAAVGPQEQEMGFPADLAGVLQMVILAALALPDKEITAGQNLTEPQGVVAAVLAQLAVMALGRPLLDRVGLG
jgi:hypothetical protein